MKESNTKFLVDAIQTAYLWKHRNYYGDKNSVIRALGKRISAGGRAEVECEKAFNLGLAIINATEQAIEDHSIISCLSAAEVKHIAEEIALDVRKVVPGSTDEMVEYAMGMLFWMRIMR